MTRKIHLAAFLISGPVAHSHQIWRKQPPGAFLAANYYLDIARKLEQGLFDLAFFADRLAVSNRYGNSHQFGVKYGDQDATRLDPLPLLSAMSTATQHLGLGLTRSTTYYQPFSLARELSTLDHLSAGRAAWNVVTSVNEGEARNFGLKTHLNHDQRYDRADEFLELTNKLWHSWEPDALKLDAEFGVYADPSRVHKVVHQGTYFETEGLLNLPSSPQERPVIIQAGSSGRGQDFAARWAEVVFSIQSDLSRMQAFYTSLKQRSGQFGRSADDINILTAVMPFVASTAAEAQEQLEEHNRDIRPQVGLSTLSAHMNVDFSVYSPDLPLRELKDLQVCGMQGIFSLAQSLGDERSLTLGHVGRLYAQSVLVPQVAGTPVQVADWLEEAFRERGSDGFVISPASLPRGFDAFVEGVVPELQNRGLFRESYQGNTLRENLQHS
jgi:FMN-dependent oxidoreductase, nitrilotriacetate monooxygenase family